ncbi:dihydrofolate reductase family protein [Gimesia panareensis]|uniref:Dihydrofolate reductase n=1 Tax=Gimesia panareensis TaxID=2527978 RepID=A0A518FUW1_9PLAN|nr:dihydrofolate reductase family protein [Gimesia panareensis]QDU52350.1 Dihydrofolate reductase [Gimesia panareensis]QDV20127.1 Dihydrofolate reductase [Gimesia panareensis]
MRGHVFIATSLDGFIARENGALDWLPGSDGAAEQTGEDFGYQAFMDSIDVLVMGRNTFEMVLSFGSWPYGEKRVIVLSSKSLTLPDHLPDSVESRCSTPADLFQSLSEEGHQSAYIDGGNTIQRFLAAGLIDEMIITRIPILIGQGISLFGPLENDIQVQHLETHSFENGFTQSRYSLHQTKA